MQTTQNQTQSSSGGNNRPPRRPTNKGTGNSGGGRGRKFPEINFHLLNRNLVALFFHYYARAFGEGNHREAAYWFGVARKVRRMDRRGAFWVEISWVHAFQEWEHAVILAQGSGWEVVHTTPPQSGLKEDNPMGTALNEGLGYGPSALLHKTFGGKTAALYLCVYREKDQDDCLAAYLNNQPLASSLAELEQYFRGGSDGAVQAQLFPTGPAGTPAGEVSQEEPANNLIPFPATASPASEPSDE
jgi:hypothetical protein